jgi:hypothetical protein
VERRRAQSRQFRWSWRVYARSRGACVINLVACSRIASGCCAPAGGRHDSGSGGRKACRASQCHPVGVGQQARATGHHDDRAWGHASIGRNQSDAGARAAGRGTRAVAGSWWWLSPRTQPWRSWTCRFLGESVGIPSAPSRGAAEHCCCRGALACRDGSHGAATAQRGAVPSAAPRAPHHRSFGLPLDRRVGRSGHFSRTRTGALPCARLTDAGHAGHGVRCTACHRVRCSTGHGVRCSTGRGDWCLGGRC